MSAVGKEEDMFRVFPISENFAQYTLIELTLALCKAPTFVSFFFFLKKVEDAL